MTDMLEVPEGYSFVKPINSGGFGSVVELIENSTQIHYAGKMIPCVTAKDKERIDREVNRLRKFAHPGIVGLKEVVPMGNMKVIVMELGEQSLADLVLDHTSRGVLVTREVVYRVMVDVSSALNLMHNHESGSTAHGDVKMENILVFPGGHFKLCDLGAAESEDVSSTRSVMSQLYVSPERMESETGRATCSSDVWALGIVLHWLLFGEPPFTSKSLLKLGREIGSFRVSMIGSSCGGEERVLLMRMLDPNPETRVTSSQLCSFGVFRCLVNTPSGVWRLKDADDKEHLEKEEKWKKELDMGRNIHKQDLETIQRLEMELKKEKERATQLEMETTKQRTNQIRPLLQPAPHSSGVRSNGPLASSAVRQGTVIRSQIGAAAIDLFDGAHWTVSGNIFTKSQYSWSSLVSFEFGAVVARLSLTIRNGQTLNFVVGILSSSLSNEALTTYFPNLKGGAGWNLPPNRRSSTQNRKETNNGSACLAGRTGQRVVLEADGREGKRTLKLLQDGETAPVPFRFAVDIFNRNNAVEIETTPPTIVSLPPQHGQPTPDESEKVAKRAQQRVFILAEILSTEKTFVAQLQAFHDVFSEPCRSRREQLGLSEMDIKSIFSQLKVILSTNIELLKQLQVSIEENGGEGVGKEIASRSAYLRCDTLSINNNTNSQNTIADLQKNNKAFRKFLKECSQNPASLNFPIESFLILPVQRLPRYKMLIEQLLKYTEMNHQKIRTDRVSFDDGKSIDRMEQPAGHELT
ncbi:putative CAMK family protein kinase [Blattamonas nauphoetae]|uniref:CAMK family protein kinase n=1 Tax=Blattamonas nauphoetae TaxID=2049346 RepID=A0ABQ9X566_9EUKA|nr:putative CAMK family protein kinase [Blattamonas nauphoetae]